MSVDVPSNGQSVQGNFAVSGWALDFGTSGGSGVDTVHIWAQSHATGQYKFLGAANMGVSRPDVGGVFGAQFAAAGFGMSASLPPGTYNITVFAHSVVSNSFSVAVTKQITVVTPPSRPVMFIDLPTPEFVTTRGTIFTISGWALDLSASSGGGVDAVHVWALPTNGAAPILVAAGPANGAAAMSQPTSARNLRTARILYRVPCRLATTTS